LRKIALLAMAGIAFTALPSRSAPISDQIKARNRISDSIAIEKAFARPAATPDTSATQNSPTNDPATAPTTPQAPAKPASDTSEIKQLPPRTLPFKQQMMFAGGFMVFVALMLTSMQNFNPND